MTEAEQNQQLRQRNDRIQRAYTIDRAVRPEVHAEARREAAKMLVAGLFVGRGLRNIFGGRG